MGRPKLYRLLEYPLVYSISQKVLAPGSDLLLKKRYKNVFSKLRGLVLDVGCGPLLTTPLPNGTIIGIDINPLYVKKYAGVDVERNPNSIKEYIDQRARFGVVCSAEHLAFKDGIFDETRCSGLLHHLPTESALRTIKEMLRCTRPLGKVIIFDNVWPKNPIYRPLAWLTRRFDRGEWVRTDEQLLNLAYTTYDGNWQHGRFTYTFTGLEAILLTIERPEKY